MNKHDAQTSANRVMHRADELGKISSSLPTLTRTYLSPEHKAVNLIVGAWMQEAGMTVWQDTVGNICGRYEGKVPHAPAILLGSHLDTVKNAGKYDGMLGVLTALEVVEYLNKNDIILPVAVEIVGFADEEGTRFGVTLLGSHALTGQWKPEWLHAKDENGITITQAMQDFDLDPQKIHLAQRQKSDILAYLELHIEQGPCLEAKHTALGIVTAINGARRLTCTFTGEAGHAGTVPMLHRKDALSAAAEWIVAIENITKQTGQDLVATVGKVENFPNAVNVISGQVQVSLDIRGPQDQAIDDLLTLLLTQAKHISTARGITFESHEFYRISATACDKQLQKKWQTALETIQSEMPVYLPSGAGHDAIAIAHQWPVSMLFVRCEKGISHNPAEAVDPADVTLAIEAYTAMVLFWQ